MFTVTLIGPDGVGKTTVAKELEATFKLPTKYIYMGMNVEASNVMLPTTRWWETRKKDKGITGHDMSRTIIESTTSVQNEPVGEDITTPPTSLRKSLVRKIRKSVGLGNRILEEWYRQFVAWTYVKRGVIVIYDRHFIYDYYHDDIHPSDQAISLKRKIHGFVLKHTLREPDLLICLDAPGEVVFARKGEFTPEFMEMRRHQYLELQHIVKNCRIIDATEPLETVVDKAKEALFQFSQDRKQNG